MQIQKIDLNYNPPNQEKMNPAITSSIKGTSFTSTYRVPFHQSSQGITPGKKDALKTLARKYGGIVPKYREGNVKFSCRKRFDPIVETILKKLGFKAYTKVQLHNVPMDQIVDALEHKGRFKSIK